MKTRLIIILLTVFFLVSCKTEREDKFKKLVYGEWNFARIEKKKETIDPDKVFRQLKSPWNKMSGYTFLQNNLCENKLGYFNRIKGRIIFFGTQTKYKIEDDSLKIFNLTDSTWDSKKILEISSDTLTLIFKDSFLVKYAKANYKVDKKQLFDKVIVSSTPCERMCDVNDISVDKQGEIIFYGQEYNTVTGLFSTKISHNDYLKIEQRFKKANIDKLKNKYSSSESSGRTISITFIKDNKIYKTITDYGYTSPIDFFCAYMPLKFMYQIIKLKPLVVSNFEQLTSNYIILESDGKYLDIEKSEMFYLITELYKSKEVKHNFESKYNLVFWDNELKKQIIKTDGRFYQLEKKGLTVTVDLGYNFLTRNNLSNKFRKKTE